MPSAKKQRSKQRRLEKEKESRREQILHFLRDDLHDDMVQLKMKEYVTHIGSFLNQLRSASSLQSFYLEVFDSIDDHLTSFFANLKESKVFHDMVRDRVPDSTVTEIKDCIESFIHDIPTILEVENKAGTAMFLQHRQEGIDFCSVHDHYDCGLQIFHSDHRNFSYDLYHEAMNLLAELAYKFIDDPATDGNFAAHYRMAADILTKRFKMLDTHEGAFLLAQEVSGHLASDIKSAGVSNGKLQKNRAIAFFFVGVMIVLTSNFDEGYCPYVMEQDLRDLCYGGDWSVVEFVSRRIPCNCLDVAIEKMRVRSKDSTCFVCKTILELEDCKVCTGCYVNHYCSRECQRKDWPNHRDTCRRLRPYVVKFREEKGIEKGNHDEFRKAWKGKTGRDI